MGHASEAFSHDARIITCGNCGAPLTVEIEGGVFSCEYCSTRNQVARRDDAVDLQQARLGDAVELSESERIASLRNQDRSPHPAPTMEYVVDGEVPSFFVRKATEAWKQLRVEAGRSNAFVLQERLFFLTVFLAPSLDDRTQRAFLETAIEILQDRRYRQILRCLLATLAARSGDVAAAESWLSFCDSRPLDLEMDTAYRRAAATAAVAQANGPRVVELLGIAEGDIPLADREEAACRVLRIHGQELLGRVAEAGAELLSRIEQVGLERVKTELARHAPLELCSESLAWALEQRRLAAEAAEETARAKEQSKREEEIWELEAALAHTNLVSGDMVLRRAVVAALACCAFSLLWNAIFLTAAQTDPLFGGVGALLCPGYCDDCTPPLMAVAWSTTSNGSRSQEGAFLCSAKDGRVAELTFAEIIDKVDDDDPAMMKYHLPFLLVTFTVGGLLFLVVFPLLLGLGIRTRYRERRTLESRLAAIRLGA